MAIRKTPQALIKATTKVERPKPGRPKKKPPGVSGYRSFATAPSGFKTAYQIDALNQIGNAVISSEIEINDGNATKRRVKREDLRKMMTDDEISQAFMTRQSALHALPFHFKSNKKNREDEVALLATMFSNFRNQFVGACWSACPYGLAIVDLVVEDREVDGRALVWPKTARELDFSRFTVDKDGVLYAKSSTGKPRPVEEVGKKVFLVLNEPTELAPMGRAILSMLWYAWIYRTHGFDMWARTLERFGSPFFVAYLEDPTVTLPDGRSLIDVVRHALDSATRGSAMAMGKDDKVDVLKGDVSADAFDKFASKVEARIAKVVLGQTLTSGGEKGGSYALGKVHSEVRDDKRDGDASMVLAACQQLANTLWELNEFVGPPPEFAWTMEQDLQIERAARDVNLTTSLASSNLRLSEQYYLDAYGLPRDHVEQKPAASLGSLFSADRGARKTFAPKKKIENPTDLGDKITDWAIENAPKTALSFDSFRKAIAKARTPEELQSIMEKSLKPDELREFAQWVLSVRANSAIAGGESAEVR
jgi:phage gp29-like protein